MATKLKVLVQRAESKDYVDVAALLDAGISLETGLAGAIALYGLQLNPALPLRARSYFEDGDLPTLSPRIKSQLATAAAAVQSVPTLSRRSDLVFG